VFFVAAKTAEPIKHNDKIKTNCIRIACSKRLNHKGHEEHQGKAPMTKPQ
jgi:hypothetical protein